MTMFKTFICFRDDLPGDTYSIVSPDGGRILFTGSLSRCRDKLDFFERKYSKSLPKQLELQFYEE